MREYKTKLLNLLTSEWAIVGAAGLGLGGFLNVFLQPYMSGKAVSGAVAAVCGSYLLGLYISERHSRNKTNTA